MTPLVSVAMTAYNRERYIGSSIESVLGQTLADFELIIVDDGSRDATVEIARRYAARDSRVRVVFNEKNLGDYPNRNYAASLVRGRFFKYHDSDDLMYPHCLATMVSLLAAEPRAAFAVSTGWAWPGGPCPMLLTPRMCYQREFLGPGLFMAGPASALFRTDVFRELGGFEDHGVPSDFVFWMKACARHAALLVSADLFWYREHTEQELKSDRATRQRAHVAGMTWQALRAGRCPLEGDELEIARRNHTFIVAKEIWRDLKRGAIAAAGYRFQHSGLSPLEWAKYLRRPQRSALAGTPLTEDGDYVVPEWVQGEREHVRG